MTLRDISGKEILDPDNLPIVYLPKRKTKQNVIKIKDHENGEGTYQKFYGFTNTKIPNENISKFIESNIQDIKFLFLTKDSKPPYEFYQYLNYKEHSKRTYQVTGKWEDHFMHKPIKVKKDDGSIAYIYKDGKAIDYSTLDLDIYKRSRVDYRIKNTEDFNIKQRGKNICIFKDKNEKYGVVNMEGKIILPFEYKDAFLLKHGVNNLFIHYVMAKKEDTYHIFDNTGSKVSDFEWIEAGNNRIAGPSTSIGVGNIYRLKSSNTEYLIDYQLRAVQEKSTNQSIIDQSKFIIKSGSEEVLNDYKNSNLAGSLSSFIAFNGKKYTHIFDTRGKYIKSIEGKFLYVEPIFKDNLKYGEDVARPSAIGKIKKRNSYYWVRLSDGMKYSED